MRIMLLLVFLATTLLMAEEIKMTTPEGTFTFQVNQVNSDGSVQSGAIIDQIGAKLEILEKDHLSKLNRLDQTRAKQLMDEIYSLLATLPTDGRANVKSGSQTTQSSTQTTSSMTINLNVNESAQSAPPPTASPTPAPAPAPVPAVHQPMTAGEFSTLVSNVEEESFADDKKSVIQIAAKSHWFTMDQLIRLVGLFNFSEDKVETVRMVYPKVVDPENAHNLLSAFTFSDDKQAVQRIINEN
jgi:hypothetical protein